MSKSINIDNLNEVGDGQFAVAYRLSPRRVIKVFRTDDTEEEKMLIEDEIEGSKRPGCLPVLRTMVVTECGIEKIGLVKKYIPYKLDYNNEKDMDDYNEFDKTYCYCDCHAQNVMRDYNGILYMVDTQTDLP